MIEPRSILHTLQTRNGAFYVNVYSQTFNPYYTCYAVTTSLRFGTRQWPA